MARSRDDDYTPPRDPTYEPPPAPVTPATDDAARLRDLRLMNSRDQLNDADKAEMATLSAAESEAAGHPVPVEGVAEKDDGSWVLYEILALIDTMIELDPRYAGLAQRARALRARFDEIRANPPKG